MGYGQGFTQLASGAVRLAYAQGQKADANRRLRNLGEMPEMTVAPETYENQTLARINATNGLPSAQYNQAMRNIQRQQNAAIMRAQDRRSAGALIPAIQQVSDNAYGNLDAKNANARLANERGLMGANRDVAAMRKAIYLNYINKKWIPQYNYAMSEKGAGNANTIAGLDSVIAGGASLAGGMGGGSGFSGMMGGGSSGGGAIANPAAQQIGGSIGGYLGG